jgi:nitrogen fixation NifU-like protein
MSAPYEIHEEIILDHHKRPRNFRVLIDCTCAAEGVNPSCGDEVKVFIRIEEDVLSDISFQGQGCAISRAAASLMTVRCKGRSSAEVKEVASRVRAMLLETKDAMSADLGDLAALSGVRRFPARVKCALLPWHTLEAALAGRARATSE